MSEFKAMKIEYDGPVAIVSFNRPDMLNAIDASIRDEFLAVANTVNNDDAIRVVILTGEGRCFCAGADLAEKVPAGVGVEDMLNQQYKPALMAITEAPKPWISAVRGAAAGVGSAFAMNCDLTVMAEDGYIYQAFAAIGLVPDGGATWHLARTVGRKKAFELIAGGEKLRAEDCLQYGLCNRVVPGHELMSATIAWAHELAAKAPLSLRYAKESLNAAMEISVADVISNEARLQAKCIASEDAAEGALAFLQKRPAQFKGR